MLSRAQQFLTLREYYVMCMQVCEVQSDVTDAQQREYARGQQRILEMVTDRLFSMRTDMEPVQVQRKVVSLLNWLVGQKVCWMSGQHRRRSSHNPQKAWRVEGAIAQIDEIIPQLYRLLSPDWKSSSTLHGLAFQVFHRRDLDWTCTTDTACQRWCGPQREQWYQEVAIIQLTQAHDQLNKVFRVTNHIDQPWTRNREVAWSLDMHAFTSRLTQQRPSTLPMPTGPSYPCSTSVGDVVVSLLSGVAWVVAPIGFQILAPGEGENT